MSNTYVTDHALAARVEHAEARANVASIGARAAAEPHCGATWIEVDGTFALFDGPRSPLTQTFGLGMHGAPTPAALDTIESFFSSRNTDTMHETCPLADPQLLRILPDRGYRPIEQSTVLYQPLNAATHQVAQRDSRIHVRVSDEREATLWARVTSRGWSDTPDLAQFMLDFGHIYASADGILGFIAEWNGEPAAAAALSIRDGVALLAGASTIPEFRGRGLQTALLQARLAHGARVGCDLAMMVAAPGSGSQRNAERRGFRIGFTRTKWTLAKNAVARVDAGFEERIVETHIARDNAGSTRDAH
jgi:GNAT superfamily N-acetyltransferase